MVNVKFYGKLKQFGTEFELDVKDTAEVIRALCTQIKGLRQVLQQGYYKVRIGKDYINPEALEKGLFYCLKDGQTVHFTPVIKGAKSGGVFQTILGVALIGASFFIPGAGLLGGLITKSAVMGLGIAMTLGGVSQMLTRMPNADTARDEKEKKSSTAFSNLTANKLSANAVTAGKIQAGAINANHLQAGQISADKLAIGLGGNLLQNAILSNNAYGWGVGAKSTSFAVNNQFTKKNGVADWYPNDALDNEVRIKTIVTVATATNVGWVDPLYRTVFLNAGQWYMFSIYANIYRFQTGYILVEEYSADGSAYVKGVASSATPIVNGSAQKTIKGMSRYAVKFQCPASGCVSLRFRCSGTTTGANPNVYVARPMLEECTQYTTQPSAWVNSGVTAIHGGSIVTNTITAQQIAANTITANEIASGAIATRHLSANSVNAGHIVSKSLTADKLNISSLSAISANLGSVTAGSIRIGSLNGSYGTLFEVNANGGFRLIARDSSGGIELSSSTRALTVWNGNTQVVKVGKL